ncbi:MAG: DnaJ domain-containing protein [Isosphaeraceae bacterium]
MTRDVNETPAFACCSAGIGRWYWVAWASESDALAGAPILASGFEKNAEAAARKAVASVGPDSKRLPAKWANRHRRGGGLTARAEADPTTDVKPKSRLSRPVGKSRNDRGQTRLSFLCFATESDRPGEVAVSKHRIVRQTRGKFHVDREPFREEDGANREEGDSETSKPRTLAVDRETLRREGRAPHRGAYFYASEEDGIRDVHASLTSRHAWCAALGIKFPCSTESIKAAYRRLARATHPDSGGVSEEFLAVERAYRAALAYLEGKGDIWDSGRSRASKSNQV